MAERITRDTITFQLRQEHLALLEHVNIRWSNVEYGGPGVDEKRPFGNSGSGYIEREICEYLGLDPISEDRHGAPIYDEDERHDAVQRYEELDTALQIILTCQTFTPGVFEKQQYGRDWERVVVEHGDDCPSCGTEVSLSIASMNGKWWCDECGVMQNI